MSTAQGRIYVPVSLPFFVQMLLECCFMVSFRASQHLTAVITKTFLYNVDPLKPHFYIVKLGFSGVYIIFVISAKNIDCGRGGSNEYPQSMF